MPGVDTVFVGPFDLCFSLGLFQRHGFPQGLASDEFRAARRRVVACCASAGVAAGIFSTGAGDAPGLLTEGFSLLAVGTDVGLVDEGLQRSTAEVERLRAGARKAQLP